MSSFGSARRAVVAGASDARLALRAVDCGRYRDIYMCLFRKEGQREPCDRCPNNPMNIRRRLDRLERRTVSGNEEETGLSAEINHSKVIFDVAAVPGGGDQ